jgi:hypothetical protein
MDAPNYSFIFKCSTESIQNIREFLSSLSRPFCSSSGNTCLFIELAAFLDHLHRPVIVLRIRALGIIIICPSSGHLSNSFKPTHLTIASVTPHRSMLNWFVSKKFL